MAGTYVGGSCDKRSTLLFGGYDLFKIPCYIFLLFFKCCAINYAHKQIL